MYHQICNKEEIIIKSKKIKGLLLLFLLIGLYSFWLFLESATDYITEFLFLWEKTFRPNWEILTAGMSKQEIFSTYLLPYMRLRKFLINIIFILALRSLFNWYNGNKDNSIAKNNSFFYFLRKKILI